VANQVQSAFFFQLHPEIYPIDSRKYQLANSGYDLDNAILDLLKEKTIPEPAIFVTSLAYSTKEDGEKADCFYFSETSYRFADKKCVVSTYPWDHLDGKRDVERYILVTLADVITKYFVAFPISHREPRCCVNDHCDNYADIDKCFEKDGWCSECQRILDTKLRAHEISLWTIASTKKLFNRAAGRSVCFVAMPFKPEMDSIYQRVHRTLSDLGWVVVRADEMTFPQNVSKAIFFGISTSDLVVADLTGNNANVCYELGIAWSIGKPIILLTQEDKVPFDLYDLRHITYQCDLSSQERLEKDLQKQVGKAFS